MNKPDKIRVLLVDDNPDLLEIMATNLSEMGFLVFCAAAADDAMKVISCSPIDVVLTDIRMPNGDGIYLLKRIRDEAVRVPGMLFVTAYADLMTQEDIEKSGAFQLLAKPVDRNILYRAVIAAAASARARNSPAAA